MTKYKLVPVEPTMEMVEAAYARTDWGPPGYDDAPDGAASAEKAWAAMLSAAPSPDGDEVERVAEAIYESNPMPDRTNGRTRDFVPWCEASKYEHIGNRCREQARAALSALPRRETVPTLTEDERARLALVRERHKNREEDGLSKAPLSSATLIVCHTDRAILLSLISKLMGEG